MGEKNWRVDNRFIVDRPMIIKELAKRHYFDVGDVEIIFDGLVELFKEIIAQNKIIKIFGLFKIYLTDVEGHDGYDAVRRKKLYIPTYRKVLMTPYSGLAEAAKLSMLPTEEKEGHPYFKNDLEILGNHGKLKEDEVADLEMELSDEDWDEMVSEKNEDQ